MFPFYLGGSAIFKRGGAGGEAPCRGLGGVPRISPFFYTRQMGILVAFTLVCPYRSGYYGSYYTYNICRYYHYCRGCTYHTYRVIANSICGTTFTRNPQRTTHKQACRKFPSSPQQISSTRHRRPLPYSR